MEVQASFGVRGPDLDTIFATGFTQDRCIDALTRAQALFHPTFPGWALYRRVLTGDALLDRALEAYAIGMARGVARARKVNGRCVVPPGSRGRWVAQAGRDALDFVLFGKYPATTMQRASLFRMRDETYKRVRDTVAWGLWTGLDTFAAEAKYQYVRLARSQTEKS